uniref:NACHT, LRR and PYD domains-containing protein 6 n=1 Tax=Esox lucius TaxID=8010 RepID=C1BWE4_ESOLU|nr:NACHT, LRR and PYD domains-containing protein 6 [Esox lucius]
MGISSDELLAILDELGAAEVKRFQWYLNKGVLEGFPSIPKGRLEDKDRTDIVDTMVQAYNMDGAVTITVEILKKMNQNSLAGKLQENL